ncbi:hypothetical protein CL633_01120 [bacterium]|nr:hypothetical protein [bacterium]|tara:strand:+ start:4268 stop:4927 length:660 start_codon:yes stop_codon:yes gene_type:complete
MLNIASFMLEKGISQETIILLLMIPILATLIAFIRQVIGIKAFGVYGPLITAFAFWGTGLKYGTIFFIIILITATLVRFLVKKLRLLYLPRIAIVLTIVSITMIISFILISILGQNGFLKISIFPILILIMLVEKFVGAQMTKSLRTAIMLSIETLALGILGYSILSWQSMQEILLKYPWLILITIFINILLGKWTGLRLTELRRFNAIIKHAKNISKK